MMNTYFVDDHMKFELIREGHLVKKKCLFLAKFSLALRRVHPEVVIIFKFDPTNLAFPQGKHFGTTSLHFEKPILLESTNLSQSCVYF